MHFSEFNYHGWCCLITVATAYGFGLVEEVAGSGKYSGPFWPQPTKVAKLPIWTPSIISIPIFLIIMLIFTIANPLKNA
jgi:TRAP-type C4-dicarboxylate transport system permease small subunit